MKICLQIIPESFLGAFHKAFSCRAVHCPEVEWLLTVVSAIIRSLMNNALVHFSVLMNYSYRLWILHHMVCSCECTYMYVLYWPEEGMVVDAILPQLFAAVVRVHVKPDCVLFPRLLVGTQLDVESPPLERNLTNIDPAMRGEIILTPVIRTH